MNTWHDKLSQQLFGAEDFATLDWHFCLVVDATIFLVVLLIAALSFIIFRKMLTGVVHKMIQKTSNTWDDTLLKSKLSNWIAMLLPALIVLKAAPHAIITRHDGVTIFADTVQSAATISIIILAYLAFNSVLNIIERIYQRFEVSRELPIKGIFQIIKIILLIAATILIISTLIGKSPVLIFSGLGAMTAIIILIFKDSILGLVAGIQLSANRMIARGDWIEMPKFGADGEVMEVALTTVKVKNWDKTITTIPTYALISDSFKNWRGMSSSGVRRIKRSVNIDMSTVEFLDTTQMAKMQQISLLTNYIADKEKEIIAWNQSNKSVDTTNKVNARSLTNLGTFRAYIREYLHNHPKISSDETLLVRQLQPSEYGIPIEIYVFTTDNEWIKHEDIQSDIFDHFLSILPEFGLRAFQSPSDQSFLNLNTHR